MSENNTSTGFQRRKKMAWQFIPHLIEEYREKGCRQQAAALTYMTLFAIVPTMTVVFTMFSLFPAFDGLSNQLQDFLFRYLLPESGLEVETQLKEFTQQARSLTLAGVIMLVATAYLMIKNIEGTFNRIWGVVGARRGLNNFLLYWAILSLGPLLLGVGVATSTYLLSLRFFSEGYDPTGLIPLLLGYFPWLMTTAAFTLLFAAVPNCKVPIKNALVGGFLTAIFFELFKVLFGWVVGQMSFAAVYGTFAMVPLFLLWIYILWVIVLSGAVVVCALTNFSMLRDTTTARYPDLIAALLALWALRQCQRTGRVANDEDLLNVGVEAEQWLRVRESLVRHRVITLTQEDEY
ncbi:YihY family inner membrane protein, partial [Pseudomaricurvus sp.]|uniref:YihY family inner membrane protein n=1 Tax=Pseudomaricurvus sp. TaxID=2004510 RepID=UPI003F6D8EE2